MTNKEQYKMTQRIFSTTAPYRNTYQGTATRLLFVCSVGLLRSPTAADQATLRGYNARSCGSAIDTALIPITANLIYWADAIIFMTQDNYDTALREFRDTTCVDVLKYKSVVWGIDDDYERNDPELVKIVNQRLDALVVSGGI
jgi:predicted protein tyrosine phosphatase